MGFWSKLNSGDARGTIAVVGAVGAPHGGDPESTLELSAQGDYFIQPRGPDFLVPAFQSRHVL